MEQHESEIYPVNEYIEQATKFLTKKHNITEDEARKFVKEQIYARSNIPKVKYYYRNNTGDKVVRETKITNYIKEAIKDDDVIVPSFTTYIRDNKQKSIHSEFMASNTKKRSVYKKAAFKAKQDGDMDTYNNMNSMQKATKILNNSLSGVYGSKSTILNNPSAHYTLTSMTRCISSIGNSVTESFIYGNKHFKDKDVTLNYITTVIQNINIDNVKICIRKFKLHIPTVDEVMDMLENSYKWYWRDVDLEQEVRSYVETLTDEERVAVMYTNDIWHMRIYNPELIRNIITELITIHTDPTLSANVMDNVPELYQILTKFILNKEIQGLNIDYKQLENEELGAKIFGTTVHILRVMKAIDKLFKTFFLTNILPPSIAYVKEMFRDGIVLSDTDSTCCSYDKWVEWYGDDSKGAAIAGTMVTFLTLCIENGLYQLSKNMNISKDKRKVLAMKNEFYWPVFIAANTNKHYYATVTIQEGNVFKQPDLEIKGVHFIASNANQEIVQVVKAMMKEILDKLTNNEQLSLIEYMQRVKDLELRIEDKVVKGDVNIFKTINIKDKSSYAAAVGQSPYFHYLLWKEVFSPKYGESDKPPYMAIKVPTILDNNKVLDEWLTNMEDQDLSARLTSFLKEHKKTSLGTINLPLTVISSKGIPKELVNIINVKRLIQDNLQSGYLVLETLGLYLKEDQLVKDII